MGGTKPLTPAGRASERSYNSEEDAAGEPGALRGADPARLTLFGSTPLYLRNGGLIEYA